MQFGVLALLFIVSALLFFYLYQLLYQPEAKAQRSEREVFNRFSAKYDLSAREREVLRNRIEYALPPLQILPEIVEDLRRMRGIG